MKSLFFLVISIFIVSACFTQVDTSTLLKIENCNDLTLRDERTYDFSFLKNALADKQYVFLGERDHGDGETLLAKVKMIKYLHENLGFDVLISEDGIYETYKASNIIIERRDSSVGVLSCLKYLDCNTIGKHDIYLGKYIDSCLDKKTLIISGLDIFDNETFENDFADKLKSLLYKLHYDFDNKDNSFYYQNFFSSNTFKTAKDEKKFYKNRTKNFVQSSGDSLISFINKAMIRDSNLVDSLTCTYFIRFIESRKAVDKDLSISLVNENDSVKFFNYRDTVMSENLKFLLNGPFKNKKVIISTATAHMTRNIEDYYVNKKFNEYKNMIVHLDSEILKKSYSLAFLTYKGRSGVPGAIVFNYEKPLLSRPITSLEYFLSRKYDYCYLDCNKNKEYKCFLEAKSITPILDYSYKLKWFSMYDGIFFIKHMKPLEISYMLERTGKKF